MLCDKVTILILISVCCSIDFYSLFSFLCAFLIYFSFLSCFYFFALHYGCKALRNVTLKKVYNKNLLLLYIVIGGCNTH